MMSTLTRTSLKFTTTFNAVEWLSNCPIYLVQFYTTKIYKFMVLSWWQHLLLAAYISLWMEFKALTKLGLATTGTLDSVVQYSKKKASYISSCSGSAVTFLLAWQSWVSQLERGVRVWKSNGPNVCASSGKIAHPQQKRQNTDQLLSENLFELIASQETLLAEPFIHLTIISDLLLNTRPSNFSIR